MVTKSGANPVPRRRLRLPEAVFLNANIFDNNLNGMPKQNTHQHQYGGTFGGPIKKDKIFVFGSFEGYEWPGRKVHAERFPDL